MKNISRRVFIKGMAVAAVATAASTVLTGCKLPTGEETIPEETGATALSFANPDDSKKTLTITPLAFTTGNDVYGKGQAQLKVKVENKLGQTGSLVVFNGKADEKTFINAAAGRNGNHFSMKNGDYYVVATVYNDGLTESTVITAKNDKFFSANKSSAPTGMKDKSTEAYDINLSNLNATMKSVSIKFEVKQLLDVTKTTVVSTGKTETFTYNL